MTTTPETPPTDPAPARDRPAEPRGTPVHLPDPTFAPSLDALSQATADFRIRRDRFLGRKRISWGISVTLAVAAAAIAVINAGQTYRFVVHFSVDPAVAGSAAALIRQELAAAPASSRDDKRLAQSAQRLSSGAWSLAAPDSSSLELAVISHRHVPDMATMKNAARSLAQRIEQALRQRGEQPDEMEDALSHQINRFGQWIQTLGLQADDAAQNLPDADPKTEQDRLLAQWDQLRDQFAQQKESLEIAGRRADALRNAPAPEYGMVSTSERAKALDADVALQEDLSELEVRLADLRLQMLTVWQESAAELETLGTSQRELVRTTSPASETTLDQHSTDVLLKLQADAKKYSSLYTAFAKEWTAEFTGLKTSGPEPLSSELLDRHTAARRKLRDFLYLASRQLLSMRRTIDTLGNQGQNQAQYHVLKSSLIRDLETLRRAHDRFEFAAGAVEPSRNFRMDNALRGSQGLHRRTRERIAIIDRQLQIVARRKARARQERDRREADATVDRLRILVVNTVDELIDVQAQLNAASQASQGFVRAMVTREVTRSQLARTRSESLLVEQALEQARQKRMRFQTSPGITIIGHTTEQIPRTAMEMASISGKAAGLVLLATLLAQWWITRRQPKHDLIPEPFSSRR